MADLQVFFQPYEKLQEFLVEEREDVNARSIEQSRRNPKKGDKPKAKTPAVPAKASPATSSVAAAVNSPKPKDAAKGPPKNAKGKSKGKLGKPMSVEEKAKTPCIFHQMPNGCVHGDKCRPCETPSCKAQRLKSRFKSQAKVCGYESHSSRCDRCGIELHGRSVSFGTLEWAADTGAGRHLVSYEAVQEQGYHSSLFSGFANDSHEKLNFSTGGGFKKSSNTMGFQDQDGILGDASHFLLDSCPMVRSIGLDVEQNFVEPLFGLRLLLPFWYRRGGYWCTAGARKRKIGARVSGHGKISAAGSCRSMDPVGIQSGSRLVKSAAKKMQNWCPTTSRLDPDFFKKSAYFPKFEHLFLKF